MAKENNTWSFSSVVSGWTKITMESHSWACLAQQRRVFLHGHSLTKILPGLFFTVWLVPSKKPRSLITLGNLCLCSIHIKHVGHSLYSMLVCCTHGMRILHMYLNSRPQCQPEGSDKDMDMVAQQFLNYGNSKESLHGQQLCWFHGYIY